jgi:hypothetical protein
VNPAGKRMTAQHLPDLVGNHSDANGDDLTTTLVSGPTHGTLSLHRYGGFTCPPRPAIPPATASPPAPTTVTLLVGNTAPAAQGESYSVEADTTLPVDAAGVLDNDSDPEGDALTAVLVCSPRACGYVQPDR